MSHTNRVIVLVDMDCFYCQVEEKLNPKLEGKPIAVVQYNEWRGGGIIAVNYVAKDKGVTRHMRGNEAKEKCPEIELVKVPQQRGKADLTKYREGGKRVAEVLQTFTPLLERASIDEAYLDITQIVKDRIEQDPDQLQLEKLQNTFVVGSDINDFLLNVHSSREYLESDFMLAMGALIAEEIRSEVLKITGYKCSAGIAHNKVLAKLVCGLHKPNKQTVIPQSAVPGLFAELPLRKIQGLGGKLGVTLAESFNISTLGDLSQLSKKELTKRFDEKNANWLYNIARGIDMEPVTTKLISKSIGCCKQFQGKAALKNESDVLHWLNELADEMVERLEKDVEENNRRAKQIVVNYAQVVNKKYVSSSRSHPLSSYDSKKILENAMKIVKKNCQKPDGSYLIKFLGLNVSHFDDVKNIREITSFFKNEPAASSSKFNESLDLFEDSTRCSVYSATTEEMDDNLEDLVYLEDVYPEKCVENISVDSITDELCIENQTVPINSGSFFSRYFENTDDQSQRDFDTSKIFEENNEVELCPECNKNIPSSEFGSHVDYHFALKLVKDEAHLYNNNLVKNKSSPNKNVKRSTKKGKSPIDKSKTILTFLETRSDNLTDDSCEVCDQCKKRIKLEDIANHLDYHAAQKLHLELNVMNHNGNAAIKKRKTDTDVIVTKKNIKVRPVSSFFKTSSS